MIEIAVRYVGVASLLLICAVGTLADETQPIAPGQTIRRTTRGGVEYAITAPKAWRSKDALPLVIHVPRANGTPHRFLSAPAVQEQIEKASGRDGLLALHCAVLFEAHNKENTYSRPQVDTDRYLRLLERDVALVLEVIDQVAAEVAIQKDAVVIVGRQLAAEAALGIASRCPNRFAAVLLKETESSTGAALDDPEHLTWNILPKGDALKAARGLPVAVCYDPTEHNGAKREKYARSYHAVLRSSGFRNTTMLAGGRLSWHNFVTTEMFAWAAREISAREARRKATAERDALLVESMAYAEKNKLKSALARYAKAKAIEVEIGLDDASTDTYRVLEARGRAMLAEADALSAAKRRAAYRKVARMFKGTPLSNELQGAR